MLYIYIYITLHHCISKHVYNIPIPITSSIRTIRAVAAGLFEGGGRGPAAALDLAGAASAGGLALGSGRGGAAVELGKTMVKQGKNHGKTMGKWVKHHFSTGKP